MTLVVAMKSRIEPRCKLDTRIVIRVALEKN